VVVGFIGLGIMGGRMAANLQKAGYKLVVHDLQRQAASHHLNAGAAWADNPRALAGRSDVIFSSLPEPPDVEAVAVGPDGLIAGMKPGAAYFDLSTNSPSVVKKLHAAFAEKGLHMLDAPVSGGPERRGIPQTRDLGWRRRTSLQPVQGRARRDWGQGRVCRPDRQRHGGQARPQYVGLCN
jgi:3-hydroxyisobutyrate dehydrogenase